MKRTRDTHSRKLLLRWAAPTVFEVTPVEPVEKEEGPRTEPGREWMELVAQQGALSVVLHLEQ